MELELATIEDIAEELEKRAPMGEFVFYSPSSGMLVGAALNKDQLQHAYNLVGYASLKANVAFMENVVAEQREKLHQLRQDLGITEGDDDQ